MSKVEIMDSKEGESQRSEQLGQQTTKLKTYVRKRKKQTTELKMYVRKRKKMEERKWEELNLDCLLNVFERLGVEPRVLDVPFVCKSWYKATLNPQCWQHIEFLMFSCNSSSRLMYVDRLKELDVHRIIKFAVKRSARSVVSLVMPCNSTTELLVYVSNECPVLKYLTLSPRLSHDQMSIIPSLMSKWKNLERLTLEYSSYMDEIFTQVSLHCKNFVGLAITKAYIWKVEASDIITLLPKIKYLNLRGAFLLRKDLVMILQGCKELLYFDAKYCAGFEGDDEILKLASCIPTFICEGSREAEYSECIFAFRVTVLWWIGRLVKKLGYNDMLH